MRRLIAAGLLALSVAGCSTTPDAGDEQALVDRSTLAVQEVLADGNDRLSAVTLLRRARGVVVCPRLFRAGFFVGGEGGSCVLVGRDAAGSWSSPAFYGLGSGSFGLQAGIQDAQVMMLIMSERALTAVMDSQFKFGADAAITFATIGGSVQGATTANVGADIVAYARTRGLFAGITLDGSLLTARSEWNRGYYGRDVSPRQVVVNMEVHNPGADPLRAVLMRFGGQPAAAPATTLSPSPAPAAAAPVRRGRVQTESLSAPARRR